MDDILKDFCKHYNIRIIDTNKRVNNISKLNIDYFKNDIDYNVMYSKHHLVTEPLYTIEIPLSRLEKIAQFEKQVFNNMKDHGHYNLFEILMEQKEKEKQLRHLYPAVKLAYENYSLILKMAESGEL